MAKGPGVVSAPPNGRARALAGIASRVGMPGAIFESAIRGGSMAPAIPSGCRIRVRMRSGPPAIGDIVYFLSNEGFVVHRLVGLIRRRTGAYHALTIGDNCTIPDAPVSVDVVLGKVIEYESGASWIAPGVAAILSRRSRIVRAVALASTMSVLRFSALAASKVVDALSRLQVVARWAMGRLRGAENARRD